MADYFNQGPVNIYRGEDAAFTFNYVTSTDVSTSTFIFCIAKRQSLESPSYSTTSVTVATPTTGSGLSATIPKATTKTLDDGMYFVGLYEIQSTGQRNPVAIAAVNVIKGPATLP